MWKRYAIKAMNLGTHDLKCVTYVHHGHGFMHMCDLAFIMYKH